MEQSERQFDFHGLGLAIKDAREKRGWTQEYLAELVGRTSHTIMNIENKGQYPSFGIFIKLVTMFDISLTSSYTATAERKRAFAANILMCC